MLYPDITHYTRVKRRGGKQKLAVEIHDAYCIKDSEIMDKQPIRSNNKLLTVKDSQDDSGGYRSKNEGDRFGLEENAILKQTPSSEGTNSNKKRKQSDKPRSSKYFMCLYLDKFYIAHCLFQLVLYWQLHIVSAKRLSITLYCILFVQ